MYRMFFPPEPLRPFIDCYWIARAPVGMPFSLQENVFVDGKADLLFNFGVGYQRARLNAVQAETLSFSNVDAQRSYPVSIQQQGQIDLLSVRFRPGGLAAFLPLPAHELSDYTLNLRDGLGVEGRELEARLFDYRTNPEQQIALLNDFFLRRLNLNGSYTVARAIAASVETCAGNISIRDLSREMGYSIRSVDRVFRQSYGFSPKFYARVVRFQGALKMIARDSEISLMEVAFRCGYYDQPHFNKAFADFTGDTPEHYRAYLAAKAATPPPNLNNYY